MTLQERRLMVSLVALGGVLPAGEGQGDSSPLLRPDEAIPGILCLGLGSLVQERHGYSREHPVEGTKMVSRWSTSPMRKGLRELGMFSLEKRRLVGVGGGSLQYI